MAQIFTTPEAQQTAKSLMHDFFLAAGVITKSQRTYTPYYLSRTSFINAADKICTELINRDFNNIDAEIRQISPIYLSNLKGSRRKTLKAEAVAKSIVYMAELLGIYWDDTIRTPYEIDEFKKTLLGQAVYKYRRFTSAVSNKKSGSTRTSTQTAGGTPKNNYKQSGPQSGNVRDLKSQPGDKTHITGRLIYKIIGENTQSKNIPNVFIKPLSASGALNGTNKLFISSGNGYTDCTCYFESIIVAQKFLDYILKNCSIPTNITNLHIVKAHSDPNGYFKVGTECDECLISAKTLNETLKESTESFEEEINGWKKATKDYSNEELEELHVWMRRG